MIKPKGEFKMFYYQAEKSRFGSIINELGDYWRLEQIDEEQIVKLYDRLYKDGIGEDNEPKTINEYIRAINDCPDSRKFQIFASETEIDCE